MGDRRYRARFAEVDDMSAVMALRARVFRDGGDDRDRYDADARHGLVEDTATGAVVACFRGRVFQSAADIADCYTARFFDPTRLGASPGAPLEFGRVCVAPDVQDPIVMRQALALLFGWAMGCGAKVFFGVTSLPGPDAEPYSAAFAHVLSQAEMPPEITPMPRAPGATRFTAGTEGPESLTALPSLLRSYLAIGARVAPFAVPDPELGTLVVFTALDVDRIPAAYVRGLVKTRHGNEVSGAHQTQTTKSRGATVPRA